MDYNDFFEKNLDDERLYKQINMQDIENEVLAKVNINSIFQKINAAIRASNININKAFEFFESENYPKMVDTQDFLELLRWLKCPLDLNEQEAFFKYLHEESRDDEEGE